MRLSIDLRVELTDDLIAKLVRVVSTIEDNWHHWASPDPGDNRLTEYYRQNPMHRELLEKSFVQANAYSPPKKPFTVVVGPVVPFVAPETDWLGLDESTYYLCQRLQILVENERNDGRFYLAHLEPVKSEITQLFEGMNPAAEFSQGGGKDEICELVITRAQRATSAGIPLRLMIIVDSDADHPGHQKKSTIKIISHCQSANIPVAVLRKRAIENYIDDDVIKSYAEAYPDVELSARFVLGLNSEQRDYYPIRSGLPRKDGKVTIQNQRQAEVFADVDFPMNYAPQLPRLMAYYFDTLPRRTQENLSNRACLDEMTSLADQITWES